MTFHAIALTNFRPDLMQIRRHLAFYLNGVLIERSTVRANQTVLEFLREEEHLTGTKEGCAEGDCGACTVLVGRRQSDGMLRYRTLNACIAFTASLDGAHLVTVEHLSAQGEPLHPVQAAMVDQHGSQCGFCTPGIVMSLYGEWLAGQSVSAERYDRALQGNLCRCTGYTSIIRAALMLGNDHRADPLVIDAPAMSEKLAALEDDVRVILEDNTRITILPKDTDDLAAALVDHPEALVIAGATDAGLWVTKLVRDPGMLIVLSRMRGLEHIVVGDGALTLGARVTYSQARDDIVAHFPALETLWDRIGGEQIRNSGTIGGNIANGSPIGDTPPALIALGAAITLRRGAERRTIALEDFFISYGRQDRLPGEFIETIKVPLLDPDDHYAVYKISKRRDEDISAVLGAFRVRLDQTGTVVEAVIAFGGMAGIPMRSRAAEAALVGTAWSTQSVEAAGIRLASDLFPISDVRASAGYRMSVARNLMMRFYLETTGSKEIDLRSAAHG